MKKTHWITFLFLLSLPTLSIGEETIYINDSGADPNAAYAIKMIKLALKHIDQVYKLEITNQNFTQAKIREEVKSGKLHIAWGSSNAEVESVLKPVRIPLYKGLLGHRIFIIHKKNQEKFDRIKTLDDLKQLNLGQGKTWADTRILEANGFRLVKVNKTPSIFYMTDGERFDAFPRGALEPFRELEKYPNLPDLTVEKGLMLVYKMPYYLFVANENSRLAQQLETGLNRAIDNGTFDEVFYSDPSVRDMFEKANIKNRRVFYIDNPLLSKETPLDRKELWLDLSSIQ